MELKTIAGDIESCRKELTVTTQTDTDLAVTAQFSFPESYCAFEGHFPVKPILPAIVQLAAVRYIAEFALGEPLMPSTLSRVKFKGMVQPEDQIVVELKLKRIDKGWQGSFTIVQDTAELLSSGNITLIEKE